VGETPGAPLVRASSVAVPGAGAGAGGLRKREEPSVRAPGEGPVAVSHRARGRACDGAEGDQGVGAEDEGEDEQGAWGGAQELSQRRTGGPSTGGKAKAELPKSRSESAGAQGRRSRGFEGEGALYDAQGEQRSRWRCAQPEGARHVASGDWARHPWLRKQGPRGGLRTTLSPTGAAGGVSGQRIDRVAYPPCRGRRPRAVGATEHHANASTNSAGAGFSPHHLLALAPFGPIDLAATATGEDSSPSPTEDGVPQVALPRSSSAGRAVLRRQHSGEGEVEGAAPSSRAPDPGRSRESGAGAPGQVQGAGGQHKGAPREGGGRGALQVPKGRRGGARGQSQWRTEQWRSPGGGAEGEEGRGGGWRGWSRGGSRGAPLGGGGWVSRAPPAVGAPRGKAGRAGPSHKGSRGIHWI